MLSSVRSELTVRRDHHSKPGEQAERHAYGCSVSGRIHSPAEEPSSHVSDGHLMGTDADRAALERVNRVLGETARTAQVIEDTDHR